MSDITNTDPSPAPSNQKIQQRVTEQLKQTLQDTRHQGGAAKLASTPVSLMWFRNDLRVHDNPALWHSSQQQRPVIALFIDYEQQWRSHGLGEARIAFLRHAVKALGQQLANRRIPLLIIPANRFTDTTVILETLSNHISLAELSFNIEYEVNERKRDIRVWRWAKANQITTQRFHDQCLIPPGTVVTKSGTPFRVYSPFKKAWLNQVANYSIRPLSSPSISKKNSRLAVQQRQLFEILSQYSNCSAHAGHSMTLDSESWPMTEASCHDQLQSFIERRVHHYHQDRDFPSKTATSQLSVALAVGLLSPRQCFAESLRANEGKLNNGQAGLDSWINELIWREFYRHITVAFPDVCKHRAFKPETEYVVWRTPDTDTQAKADFEAWCEGKTGYPIVDAAQRQLLKTGWMHNRLRMITAMFLTKHLLIDWRLGEAFFNQHLMDADFSSNNGGWQWSASTGADGAPYFRIFNPISQSEKFDPDGSFIAHFVPELTQLPAHSRHFPNPIERSQTQYPEAIVEHKFARQRALEAFQNLSQPAEEAS